MEKDGPLFITELPLKAVPELTDNVAIDDGEKTWYTTLQAIATLIGGGSSVTDNILRLPAGTTIDTVLRAIVDGLGVNSGIKISTTEFEYTGNFTLASKTANTIIYLDANKRIVSLTAGSNGQVLTLVGGLPAWTAAAAGNIVIDTTGITGGVPGRLLLESGTNKVTEVSNVFWDGSKFSVVGNIEANGGTMYLSALFGGTAASPSSFPIRAGGVVIARVEAAGVFFGSNTSPGALIDGEKTSVQLRLGYDATNYWQSDTGATGIVSMTAFGSSKRFVYNSDLYIGSGVKLFAPSGANQIINGSILVAGTKAITNNKVTANSEIIPIRTLTNGGMVGNLVAVSKVAGVGFTMNSYDALGNIETGDVSSFSYLIIN